MQPELTIKFKELKNFVAKRQKDPLYTDNTEISIMYLIQVLYPKAYDNFQAQLRQQFTNGYHNGRQDTLKEYNINEN